jgi:hypothetical protein
VHDFDNLTEAGQRQLEVFGARSVFHERVDDWKVIDEESSKLLPGTGRRAHLLSKAELDTHLDSGEEIFFLIRLKVLEFERNELFRQEHPLSILRQDFLTAAGGCVAEPPVMVSEAWQG